MPDITSEMKRVSAELARPKADQMARKPTLEAVWLFVKDHPGLTGSEIALRTRMSKSIVHDAVYRLYDRAMLVAEKKKVAVPSGRGSAVCMRTLLHYSVNPKMRGVYELWDAPLKEPVAKPEPEALQDSIATGLPVLVFPRNQQTAAEKPQPQPTQAVVLTTDFDLESLPIGQARELYQKLHKLFGK